jgi:hypothetical protein
MSRAGSGWGFALAAVAGMLVIAVALVLAERRLPPPLPWAIYLGNLLFFSGAAHAAVLCAALGRLSGAAWMKPLAPLAASGIGFALLAPLGAVLLGALPGDPFVARHLPPATSPRLAAWLAPNMVLVRAVLVLVLLAAAGLAFVGAGRRAARPEATPRAASVASRLAGIYVAAYVVGLSLLAFDLVMPLVPRFRSALFGGHHAAASFAAGVAGLALASRAGARSGRPVPGPGVTATGSGTAARDLGALLAVAAFLVSYLAFTQLITIWYGNLREETGILAPLAAGSAWRGVVLATLALAYLAPFLLLVVVRRFLPGRLRGGTSLALVALILAIGLWLEQLLLVTAPFAPAGPAPLWFPAGLMALGFSAVFAGLLGLARRRLVTAAGDGEGP